MALVAIDLLLIGLYGALYVLDKLGHIDGVPAPFSITEDRGISEVLNAGKWLAISVLLVVLWMRSRMATALGFAVLFAFIAADDIFLLHDGQGAVLAERLALEGVAGLRAWDMGQLLVWALLGAAVVPAVALGFWAADEAGRRIGRTLLAFFGVLLLFAVGFDVLHILLAGIRGSDLLLSVIEDGGEMVTGSVCLAYCVALLAGTAARAPGPAGGALRP